MKKATMLAAALSIAGLAGFATAAPQQQEERHDQMGPTQGGRAGALDKQDTDFFEDAAQGGLLEVRLGQLAVKHAQSDDVRKFGQRMIDDHTKVNDQLAKIAQQKGLTMPRDLDKKHQQELDKMAQHSGAKFDREYMSRMLEEHQNDVKAFQKQAKDGKDPDLKQVAASALPTLQEHLTLANQIESRIKK